MEIELKNGKLFIREQIKTMEDYKTIKNHINDLVKGRVNEISINIANSLSIPSSVIGLLLKTVYQDNVKINIETKSKNLIALLKDLNLYKSFNIIEEDE